MPCTALCCRQAADQLYESEFRELIEETPKQEDKKIKKCNYDNYETKRGSMWRQEDTLKGWVQQFNTAGVYLAYLAVVLCNSLQEK